MIKTLKNDRVFAAVVAERLRRLTRNQIPSWSVGSNPTDRAQRFVSLPETSTFTLHRLQNLRHD